MLQTELFIVFLINLCICLNAHSHEPAHLKYTREVNEAVVFFFFIVLLKI